MRKDGDKISLDRLLDQDGKGNTEGQSTVEIESTIQDTDEQGQFKDTNEDYNTEERVNLDRLLDHGNDTSNPYTSNDIKLRGGGRGDLINIGLVVGVCLIVLIILQGIQLYKTAVQPKTEPVKRVTVTEQETVASSWGGERYGISVEEETEVETGIQVATIVTNDSTKASEVGIAIESVLFEGSVVPDNLPSDITKQLESELEEMSRLSNSTINISQAVEEQESGLGNTIDAPDGEPPEVEYEYDINGNIIGKLENTEKATEVTTQGLSDSDSKEIFYDNDVAYVNVRDIQIDNQNKFYISYKGFGYYIDASQYARTPSKLQNKEAYDLKYIGTVIVDNEYNVRFKNRVDDTEVNIIFKKGVTGKIDSYYIQGL